MDNKSQNHKNSSEIIRNQRLGTFYIFVWGVLIVCGIVAKRVYGHPNWMMFFHMPAAVFLVLGMRTMATNFNRRYRDELENYQ